MTDKSGNSESEFDLNFFASFMDKADEDIQVKTEPLDPDEIPEKSPVHEAVNKRQLSSNNSRGSEVQSRDPRLTSRNSLPNPAAAVKRQAFLSGSMTSHDLIRGSSVKDLDSQPKQVANIRNFTGQVQKAMNTKSNSFYASLSNVAVIPEGLSSNRSPVVSNNHNAHFVSRGTSENIRESLETQRYRNIPQKVQETAQRVGADLDSISQRMRVPEPDSLTSYSDISNYRTFSTQTNPVEFNQAAPQKQTKNASTQTTKNNGVFSITIDSLSELSLKQRQTLEEFKKVMNIRDEPTTGGLLERLQHRQANRSYDKSRNNNDYRQRDNNYDSRQGSSSSRERNADIYSNPPPPPKISKYANLQPY